MKSRTIIRALLAAFILAAGMTGISLANDLVIENVSLSGQDSSSGTADVSFDISWDNSWRNSRNNDAAWVFVKFSTDSGSTWDHATFAVSGTDPSGFSPGTGTELEIIVPGDRKGCFIQRVSPGAGSVGADGVTLRWKWDEDGLQPGDIVRVKVVGIEMVKVPSGPFYAGDGDGISESQYALHPSAADNTAVEISSSSVEVTCDANANDDIDDSPVMMGSSGVGGNPEFPTGYNAFYIMKYEITEGQWVDFINTISYQEKANRDITGISGKGSDATVDRNTVSWNGGEAASDRPDRACSYLSWPDICAYADWAALRPVSGLEYEKAARGSETGPREGEYAWGDTTIGQATVISGPENGTETVSNSDANCCYGDAVFSGGDGGSGPLRAGIFATDSTTRHQAGAGYYGVMEMSGNLWEKCVSAGSSAGRTFRGTSGDGILLSDTGYEGNATNTDWPGFVAGQGVNAGNGSGFRGGSWLETATGKMAISDRSEATVPSAARSADAGGRCGRTAP